jgi:hypothetical protein
MSRVLPASVVVVLLGVLAACGAPSTPSSAPTTPDGTTPSNAAPPCAGGAYALGAGVWNVEFKSASAPTGLSLDTTTNGVTHGGYTAPWGTAGLSGPINVTITSSENGLGGFQCKPAVASSNGFDLEWFAIKFATGDLVTLRAHAIVR